LSSAIGPMMASLGYALKAQSAYSDAGEVGAFFEDLAHRLQGLYVEPWKGARGHLRDHGLVVLQSSRG
jgi:hypothetical protein